MESKTILKTVKLFPLEKYLTKKGWQIQESKIKNLREVKKTIDGEDILLYIPKREDLLDYISLLDSLIRSISQIEEKDYEAVFDELLLVGYNLLKIRLIAKETEKGTILLKHAIGSIEKIRDIIKYGACSVIEPRSDYRKAFQEAILLSDNCELGQTEFGSFIIKVRVPSDEIYFDKIKNKEDYIKDLGMKTISKLIEGISEVNSLNLENEEYFKSNYNKKLNKKVCEKISELMIKEDGFDIELSAKWDPAETYEKEIESKFVKIKSNIYFKKFGKMSLYLEKT